MKKVEKFLETSKLKNGSKPIYYFIDKKGCHICVSHKAEPSGYFMITRNRISTRMHRYIYNISKGQIPNGKLVRHLCNNPSCINPEHLAIGTQKDNIEDMKKCNKKRKVAKRLTEEEKIEIITDDKLTNEQLAEKYDVNLRTIYTIIQKYKEKNLRPAA